MILLFELLPNIGGKKILASSQTVAKVSNKRRRAAASYRRNGQLIMR